MSYLDYINLHRNYLAAQSGQAQSTVQAEVEAEDEQIEPIDPPEWTRQLRESPSCRRKYRLWTETQGMCIYCGRSITVSDFINGVDSDIEHIIPQAMGGRNVLDNLACACRICNREKGDLSAMDYMLTQSPEMLQQYLKRLRLLAAAGLLTTAKYNNLTHPKSLIYNPSDTAAERPENSQKE